MSSSTLPNKRMEEEMTGRDATDFSDRKHAPAAAHTHRRSTRTPLQRPLAIYPRLRGRTGRHLARLRDYSASGIGLIGSQAVEPGTRFAVRLVWPDGHRSAMPLKSSTAAPRATTRSTLGRHCPQACPPAQPPPHRRPHPTTNPLRVANILKPPSKAKPSADGTASWTSAPKTTASGSTCILPTAPAAGVCLWIAMNSKRRFADEILS